MVTSVQVQMLNLPSQQALTKDNVSINLDSVVFFRIVDLPNALFKVQDYVSSITNLSMSAIYTMLGEMTLHELFANRQVTHVSDYRACPTTGGGRRGGEVGGGGGGAAWSAPWLRLAETR